MRRRIQRLIDTWSTKIGVVVREWNIKDMKTYWASINEKRGRIWFSSKLSDMPASFLKFVVVHELAHLLTDGHDSRFYDLMDQHIPTWRRMHAKYSVPRLTRHS